MTFPPGGGQGFPSSALVNPIVIGSELFYSPSPGFGNLVESISQAAGIDSYGNAFLPGFTAYQALGGQVVANNLSTQNQLSYYLAPTAAGPFTLVASIQADVNGNLVINANNQIGVATTLAAVVGGVFEVFKPMGLTAGWGVGNDVNANPYTPSYRLNPDGSVSLRGVLVTPAVGAVVNVIFATLPVGYRNTFSNPPTATISNAAGGQIGSVALKSTGALLLFGGFNNASNIYLDCTLRSK